MTQEKTKKIIEVVKTGKYVIEMPKKRKEKIETTAEKVDNEYSEDLIRLKD